MNSVLLCVLIFMVSQNDSQPVITEAELAAPPGMQREGRVGDDGNNSTPTNAGSQDLESEPSAPTAQTDNEVVTRWEYDEEGRPVVRTEERSEQPREEPAEEEADEESAQTQRRTGRIGTFWFVLPRR